MAILSACRARGRRLYGGSPMEPGALWSTPPMASADMTRGIGQQHALVGCVRLSPGTRQSSWAANVLMSSRSHTGTARRKYLPSYQNDIAYAPCNSEWSIRLMCKSGPVCICVPPWEGRLRQFEAAYIAFFYAIDGWSCPKSLSARDRRMTAVIGSHRQYSTAVRSKILSSAP